MDYFYRQTNPGSMGPTDRVERINKHLEIARDAFRNMQKMSRPIRPRTGSMSQRDALSEILRQREMIRELMELNPRMELVSKIGEAAIHRMDAWCAEPRKNNL